MATNLNEAENQAKGEKINMIWLFAMGILTLIWVAYALRPGKMSVSKEVPEVSRPYTPPPIH